MSDTLKFKESELFQMYEEKFGEIAAAKITEVIESHVDPYIKGAVTEQLQDALKKLDPLPTPEEKAIQEELEKRKHAFKSFGEQLGAIYRCRHFGQWDPRLVYIDSNGKACQPKLTPDAQFNPADVAVKTMTEGTDSAGGFLVFPEFRSEIYKLALEGQIVRNNGAIVIPMRSDKVHIPRVDETAHTSHLRGGVYGAWTEETGTKQASEPKWGEVQLNAHEYSGYTVASNNLLMDNAVGLEAFIRTTFAEAFGFYQDDAFIEGTGSGQPLGIINSPCLIGVTRQANTAVRFVDFANIWRRIFPSSRARGVWLLNHDVIAELIKLVAENATPAATAGSVIWINRNQGLTQQIPGAIMGRPYFETEKVPALGSASDIGFYDLGYYLIGDRMGLTIDASTHVYFLNNKTAWRFTFRVDGQPWLYSALTPKNGTNTLSCFASLTSSS